MPAKSVTANRLSDGTVVYLTPGGGWSEYVREADWREDKEEQQALLERGEADVARSIVLDAYLIDVAIGEDGTPWPTRNREVIRSLGPTTRLDLGKQAELEG
ncbi:DUF2849 domain-containing protein [Ferruginivarius sediminum]|uniref:DUF2849 domain-containing protein n=1 Tax=Ferruginivarius sediminum TaxID=2661937 RepID=A0A369TEY5_9PROT|nr:DUF2849 domain-containing protein [Ferruginivarius sediminum]RDD62935.1 DUF2849 domain-containing protein [Ferruginivarius sediminum]